MDACANNSGNKAGGRVERVERLTAFMDRAAGPFLRSSWHKISTSVKACSYSRRLCSPHTSLLTAVTEAQTHHTHNES